MELIPDIADTIKTIASVVIPPPGGQVVAAVMQVAYIVVMELRNTKCCVELAEGCLKLMGFLCGPGNERALSSDNNMKQALEVSAQRIFLPLSFAYVV